jgi:hypothetical protein
LLFDVGRFNSKDPQFGSLRIFSDQLLLLRFTIPDPSIMAEHVIRTWNKIKKLPNYELVAGELLFRR